jgi:hypothetical protein
MAPLYAHVDISGLRQRILGLGLLVLVSSCGPIRQEAVHFQFRQSMIEQQTSTDRELDTNVERSPGLRSKQRRPRSRESSRSWRRRLARRCRRLEGRRFAGTHQQATLGMLRRCLGRSVTPELLEGRSIEVRPDRPAPGDLVLFHNTRDANSNGKNDDLYSDAGVVIEIRGLRVRFIYLRRGRVLQGVLNRKHPHRRRLTTATIQNTYLRIKRRNDPPRTRYLAGQLLAGFAKVSPGREGESI